MTVQDLISILQQQDPAAVVVLSTYPGKGARDGDVTTVERIDICAVQLRAVDDGEYRKHYAVALEGDVPGVWLG